MDYLQYVNIKQGSKSTHRFSNGNTLPLVQRPFGFAAFVPQTHGGRGAWFYHPEDRSCEGIRLTHQPSPWIGDNAAILFQPQQGDPYVDGGRRWSSIDVSQTVQMPNYMKYRFNRARSTVELTPTEYGAVVRVTFDGDNKNFLSVMPVGGNYTYRYAPDTGRLYCSTVRKANYDKGNVQAFFVFDLGDSIAAEETIVECDACRENGTQIEGKSAGIHLAVKVREMEFAMATSFISFEQAERNLSREGGRTFEAVKDEGAAVWNEHLSRIQVQADEDDMKTFYSCMYRVFLYPHKAHEFDENGAPIHYSPAADAVKPGYRYTENGFWDTYRTIYPLFSLIAKDEYKEIIEGFISDYIDGGWLPCWTSVEAKKCMPSTMIDTVIADATLKGAISKELLKTAFEGMERHANQVSPIPAYGRDGVEDYLKYGYVPGDKWHESVNLTLDAAYCDYCLGRVAEVLGEREKAAKYFERAKNYRHLFDKESGFMRAKLTDGTFKEPFSPIAWGGDYTEAAAWQTTFAVQHDLDGLAELYGGAEKLLEKLDDFFTQPQEFTLDNYGFEIHEISEFAAGDWGQCAICNQPSFHIPFIYTYFGHPEKTEYWVKRMCKEAFSFADDGFPGDEDNGTTAAWYIFCAIGMYPLCPGKNEFVHFKPLFDNVKFS